MVSAAEKQATAPPCRTAVTYTMKASVPAPQVERPVFCRYDSAQRAVEVDL